MPAALRVKRDEEQPKKKPMLSAVGPQSGFGLAPAVKPVAPPKPKTDAPSVDDKYLEFMSSIADLGGFE